MKKKVIHLNNKLKKEFTLILHLNKHWFRDDTYLRCRCRSSCVKCLLSFYNFKSTIRAVDFDCNSKWCNKRAEILLSLLDDSDRYEVLLEALI